MPRTSGPSDLLVELDRRRPEALRVQLASQLREAIARGVLRPGVRLPASRVLASRLGVSRGVVVEAYEDLRLQGLIRVVPRGGPAVAAGAVPTRPPSDTAPAPLVDLSPDAPDPSLLDRRTWLRVCAAGLAGVPARTLDGRDPRGHEALRSALADHLGRARRVVADPDRVVICAGASGALRLAANLLAGRGVRRIAVAEPAPPAVRALLVAAGLEPVEAEPDGPLHVQAALVFPARQPAPAGLALLDWARRVDALLVEDDGGAELRYEGTPRAALQGLDPERVLLVGDASRVLAPATGAGWLVVPPSLAPAAPSARAALGGPTSVMEQLGLAHLLRTAGYERRLRFVREEYRRRRDPLAAALDEALPEARRSLPRTGLDLRIRLPRPVAEAAFADACAALRLRAAGPLDGAHLTVGFGCVPPLLAPFAAGRLAAALALAEGRVVDRSRW